MRLALYNDYRLGVVDPAGTTITDVSGSIPTHSTRWPWAFVLETISEFERWRPGIDQVLLNGESERLPIGQVQLRAPVPSPTKVVAAAANYWDHHDEMEHRRDAGTPSPSDQGEVFLKAPSSVTDPGSLVTLPNVPEREIHYEGELAMVIGREMRNVPEEETLSYVFGYTALLDLTVRGRGDRSRRKSYDGFTPLGPWIVTADEIPDPQALRIELRRNGEMKQNESTSEMVYSCKQILAYATSVMTLYPGDVVTTGTPSGVGTIGPNDRIDLDVSGIGRLSVSFAAAPAGWPVAEVPPLPARR